MPAPKASSHSPGRPAFLKTPLVRVIAAQAVGLVLAFGGGLAVAAIFQLVPSPWLLLVIDGIIAAWFGHRFGLPRWWLPINLAMPPAAAGASLLPVPAWIFLLVFLGLALVFWNSVRTRVPLYLTNRTTWKALEELLPQAGTAQTNIADIGSGVGGAVLHLARARPDLQITGIETAPLPLVISRLRHRLSGLANARFENADFWARDLSAFDLVYAFLSPEPMPPLYEKLKAELKPGSLLISNSFPVPGVEAELLTVGDRRRTQLYLYRF